MRLEPGERRGPGWLLGALAAVVALASSAIADEPERLAAERSRWQAAQSGDYRYAYRKFCECNREEPPLTVVTVQSGRIERVHHLHSDSEREVPAREGSLELYWTIDDLFDKLALAIERDATVRVEYHAELGYPISLFIDYDAAFDGDEIDLRLIEVEPL